MLTPIYSAAQRKKPLEYSGYLAFDCLRRHTAVEGGYHDFRNIDGGKQVHRHLHGAGHANNQDYQANHNDEVGITNGEPRHYPPSCISPR